MACILLHLFKVKILFMAEEEPLILFRLNTPLEKGRSEEAGSGEEKVLTCNRQKQIRLLVHYFFPLAEGRLCRKKCLKTLQLFQTGKMRVIFLMKIEELGHRSCTMLKRLESV